MARRELVGITFGRLTLVRRMDGPGRSRWECRCSCGNQTIVYEHELVRKNRIGTRSCGCLARETARNLLFKHGGKGSVEYRTWQGMIERCKPGHKHKFPRYAERGIKVCERWLGPCGFHSFLADMGPRPPDKQSIDRIDNDGNYEPGNCRWATWQEQESNKSTNKLIEINGKVMTQSEAARRAALDPSAIRYRLRKGITGEALLAPREHALGERNGSAKLTAEQVAQIRARLKEGRISKRALARAFGVSDGTIRNIAMAKNWRVA